MNIEEPAIRLILVAAVWAGWCVIHSMLCSKAVLENPSFRNSRIRPYYRLIYCILAVVTLVLAIRITPTEHQVLLWRWEWPLQIVQIVMLAGAVFLMYSSFGHIDVWGFLGLRAPGLMKSATGSDSGLVTTGIYGWIRHPQFSSVLLGLWARDLRDTDLVINAVLCLYVVVGAYIEERRLLEEFGDRYARYMEQIPRFVPRLTWILNPESGKRGP